MWSAHASSLREMICEGVGKKDSKWHIDFWWFLWRTKITSFTTSFCYSLFLSFTCSFRVELIDLKTNLLTNGPIFLCIFLFCFSCIPAPKLIFDFALLQLIFYFSFDFFIDLSYSNTMLLILYALAFSCFVFCLCLNSRGLIRKDAQCIFTLSSILKNKCSMFTWKGGMNIHSWGRIENSLYIKSTLLFHWY